MKFLFLLFFFLISCSRAPLKHVKDAMRQVSTTPQFSDSLSKESFFSALKKHIEVMKTSNQVMDPMIFGDKKISKEKYVEALVELLEHQEDWLAWIALNFDFYEVYGKQNWSEVMATGYYEPHVLGSHVKSNTFSQALYSPPSDLITVNLKYFADKFPKGETPATLQGRLVNKSLKPYYTRKEIDTDNILKGQNLELAWLDPIDAFFIQIQGSGVIEFENGEKIRVGYDNQNGHSYMALGKHLKNIIPSEKMSMQSIRAYLQTLSRNEQQEIMNVNPSYVFFKKLDSEALTYAGMEVSAGRTIATDLKYFPKGAMAFLDIEEPQFDSLTENEPKSWLRLPRLVFDEDIGGAIRGGGRVDLYFGSGDKAAQKAGVMKQNGSLYYLVPKLK